MLSSAQPLVYRTRDLAHRERDHARPHHWVFPFSCMRSPRNERQRQTLCDPPALLHIFESELRVFIVLCQAVDQEHVIVCLEQVRNWSPSKPTVGISIGTANGLPLAAALSRSACGSDFPLICEPPHPFLPYWQSVFVNAGQCKTASGASRGTIRKLLLRY